jgi:UDP-N-acetylmuramoyl-L-alanyl-D-glutamate--2,6-diaminopimelate ligase
VRLSQLLASSGISNAPAVHDPEVTGVSYDTRTLRPGELFFAIGGFHVDGLRYLGDAFARGAAAAVVSEGTALPQSPTDRPLIEVAEPRAALAAAAAAWNGFPARRLRTIGVTGTDGKTTTSYLVAAVLDAAGLNNGLFTTVAFKVGDRWQENESRQTTPEAPDVQRLLGEMLNAGCSDAVLESTSHGLALHKLDHCEYDVAVFTNLSPDHLDFHGTVDEYRAAKGRLFAMLDQARDKGFEKLAVLNADDPNAAYMAAQTGAHRLTYALGAAADVRPLTLKLRPDGSRVSLATPAGLIDLDVPLPGRFNIANALAAVAVGIGLGIAPDRIARGISGFGGVPGRMRRVDAGQPFTVVVDYAHTAASFEKVIQALRPLTAGRLIAVFGCAGERGSERRSGMGGVAARGVDFAVLTSEDPRAEDPERIIDDIARAMLAAGAIEGERFERVPDRRAAIARAFDIAADGDLVLLTGKGHEHSIETAVGRQPWDECAVAETLLRERLAGRA